MAGFGRTDITPPMGIPLAGYYEPRYADGVLDNLKVNALAVSNSDTTVIIASVDILEIRKELYEMYSKNVSEITGIPAENVYIVATHSHTAPVLGLNHENEMVREYTKELSKKISEAAVSALNDMSDAEMGYGKGYAPGVSFVRRFIMKDGSMETNPGTNNPNISHPAGEAIPDVNIIRFNRKNADDIILANFGNHPDVICGCKISGDWPAHLVNYVEKFFDNTKCIFINGAQGDVNHINVHPQKGWIGQGYEHSKHIARVVLGGVMQAYGTTVYTDDTSIAVNRCTVLVPSNKADKSELEEAHRINNLALAGRGHELPYRDMQLTTVLAEAARKVRLENAPDFFEITLTALKLGPVAILGFPGEPFAEIGRKVMDLEGFDMVIPNCLANGGEAYFPTIDAYEKGSFEARMSNFKPGVGELLVQKGKQLLESLR